MQNNLLSIFNSFCEGDKDPEIHAYAIFEKLLEYFDTKETSTLGNIQYLYSAFWLNKVLSKTEGAKREPKLTQWVSDLTGLCTKRFLENPGEMHLYITHFAWIENYLHEIKTKHVRQIEHVRTTAESHFRQLESRVNSYNSEQISQLLGIRFESDVVPQINDLSNGHMQINEAVFNQTSFVPFSQSNLFQIEFFYSQSSIYLGLYHDLDLTYKSNIYDLRNNIHCSPAIFRCSRPQFLHRFFNQAKRKNLIEVEDSDINQLIILLVGPNLPAASNDQSLFWPLAHPYIPDFKVTKMFCTELCRVIKRMINEGHFYSNYHPNAISNFLRKAALPNLIFEEINKYSPHQLDREEIDELRFKINKEITVKLEPILNKVIQGTNVNKSSIAILLSRLFPEISRSRYHNILKGQDDPQFKSVSKTFIFGPR